MGVLADLLAPAVSPNRRALKPFDLTPPPKQNPFDDPGFSYPKPDYLDVPFSEAVSEGAAQHIEDFGAEPETAKKLGDVFAGATQFIPAVNQTGTIIDVANSKDPVNIWAATQAGLDLATGGLAGVVKDIDAKATPEPLPQLLAPEPETSPLAETMSEAVVEQPKVTGLQHASPHDFEKFEWSPRTFGTGEGAQAFGHGLYFAEHPNVIAKNYAPKFSRVKLQLDTPEGTIHPSVSNDRVTKYAGDVLDDNRGDFEKAIAEMDRALTYKLSRSSSPEAYAQAEHNRRVMDKLKEWQRGEGGLRMEKKPATVYEVELLANPEKFLDLDAPISEQMHVWEALDPEVRAAIDDNFDNMGMNGISDAPEGYTGKDLYRALQHENVHESLPSEVGTSSWETGDTTEARHTSEYLRTRGIPGSKFKDAFSRKPKITLDGKPLPPDSGLEDAVALGEYYLSSSKTPEEALAKLETVKQTFPDRADLYDEVVGLLQSGRLKVAPPTRNYVAFSDEIVKIVKKNGVAMALAAGIITSDQAEELYAQGYE